MNDTCVICKKPIGTSKFITYSPYNKKGVTVGTYKCHIARKCTDKLPLTASERAEMDRVIAMELSNDE